MRPDEARRLFINAVLGLGAVLLIITLLFGLGLWAGRKWFPRREVIQVDRRIVEVVPVPGETKYITISVPGPIQRVEVPLEVVRYVDRPGQERIVVQTKEVEVPIEVVKREWPQTITVRVGSMLDTEGVWRTPAHPDLLIGQVAPGAYAVPQQDGWKIDQVVTETKLPSIKSADWHIEVRPAAGIGSFAGEVFGYAGARTEAIKELQRGAHIITSLLSRTTRSSTFVTLEYNWRF